MSSSRPLLAALALSLLAACIDAPDELSGGPDGGVSTATSAVTCASVAGVFTPYAAATGPSGPVSALPWRGPANASPAAPYPDGVETFEPYGAPVNVECASTKARRGHLEVTAGCLDTASTGGGAYVRGRARATADGSFRMLALGFTPDVPDEPIRWTDQVVSYRFHFTGPTGPGTNPGFKAFARYRTEDDLYVASWRLDGVVQIQRKQCGVYTALAVRKDLPPPSTGAWHTIEFRAIGDQLSLYLDHALALQATATTFDWGTSGIRLDAVDGAYLDDIRIAD